MVASIPSPDVGTLSLGPLNLRLYGLMVALGVIAGAYAAARLLQRRGLNPEWAVQVCTVGVPLGLIGARAYHVLTDWKSYQGRWGDVVKIWEGGLGIPGGILGAVLGGLIVMRMRRMPIRSVLDTVAVGFPVGQFIGRLGNWFNQELFGRPTDLPWGLEIDPEHRPRAYADAETFHPTFAYEMVWSMLVFATVWRTERRGRLPRGHLLVLYLFLYSAGRLWIEALRVDPASLLLGVRVNIWVIGGVLVLSGLFLLLVTPRRRRVEAALATAPDPEPDEGAAPDEPESLGDAEPEEESESRDPEAPEAAEPEESAEPADDAAPEEPQAAGVAKPEEGDRSDETEAPEEPSPDATAAPEEPAPAAATAPPAAGGHPA